MKKQDTATALVRRAIERDADYFHKCCAMRAGKSPTRAGSYFPRLTPARVATLIRKLRWEPYTHPNVQPPAQAFIAPHVSGVMAVVPMADVPDDTRLVFDDAKDTGMVELLWTDAPAGHGHRVEHVVALLGPDESGELELWTFFPGDPVQPSQLERHANGHDRHGQQVTAAAAEKAGVRWVKIGG